MDNILNNLSLKILQDKNAIDIKKYKKNRKKKHKTKMCIIS